MRDVARSLASRRPERHALRKRRERRGEEAACRRGGLPRARTPRRRLPAWARRARARRRGPSRRSAATRAASTSARRRLRTVAARAHPDASSRAGSAHGVHTSSADRQCSSTADAAANAAGLVTISASVLASAPRRRRQRARRRRSWPTARAGASFCVHARAGDPRAHLARAHGAAQPQLVVAATRARESTTPGPARRPRRKGTRRRPAASSVVVHVSSVAATGHVRHERRA